jgi:hypothetical protein
MLRCGICSDSILIYVVGVSSLSVAEQPLLPCHGKSGRGGNYWKLRGARQAEAEAGTPTARV